MKRNKKIKERLHRIAKQKQLTSLSEDKEKKYISVRKLVNFPFLENSNAKDIDAECNSARKNAIDNYLNQKKHLDSFREKLKEWVGKKDWIHWISI